MFYIKHSYNYFLLIIIHKITGITPHNLKLEKKSMMKIVIVNYRYFISGGPERYMFNIISVLESHGHVVIPFSVKHNKNLPSEYESYFLEPVGSGDETYGHEYKKDFKTILKVFSRMVYSFEARRKFKKLLLAEKPDVVYVLQFQNKISCSIIDVAHSLNMPIVQRISDFSLLSPCGNLYRNDTNEICELCLNKSLWNSVKYKCIYNSYSSSFIKKLSIDVLHLFRVKNKINNFVFPSTFTMSKFIETRFPEEKLHHIPTLFNLNSLNTGLSIKYDDFALYIGRIVPEKGIKVMVDAFIDTNLSLKIIGFSDTDYQKQITDYLASKSHNIEFLGELNFDQIQDYLSKCLFTIVPSEWYDNLPNSLIESFAFKKCVVATNIGSLNENIQDMENGLLFEYKNHISLRQKINLLFDNKQLAITLGENGNKLIHKKFSVENHYEKLITIFNSTIQNFKNRIA